MQQCDYPITSYLSTRLTCDRTQLETFQTAANFYRDTDYLVNNDTNEGFKQRRLRFGDWVTQPSGDKDFFFSSTPSLLLGKLFHTLPAPPLALCDIIIDIEINKPSWVLLAQDNDNADISFEIDNAQLRVPRMKINEKVFLSYKKRLETTPFRQFFNRLECLNFSVSKGSRSCVIDTIGKCTYLSIIWKCQGH